MSVIVNVQGLSELAAALQQLPRKLAGQALGASVKAGADLVRDQARANVPADTGAVRRSIVSYRKPGSRPENIAYQVGVTMKKRHHRAHSQGIRLSKKTGQWGRMWPAFYWRFVEFGTTKMPARPFLRPAFDQRSGQALALIKLMLARAVEVAAQQAPKYRG